MTINVPIENLTTNEIIHELRARAENELAQLSNELEEANTAADRARTLLRERERFYKALGFVASEAPSGSHQCADPGCDRTFDTDQGARMHHTRAHKPKTLAPAVEQPTAAKPPTPDPSGILRCSCDDRFNTVDALKLHCSIVHSRMPYADERTPR